MKELKLRESFAGSCFDRSFCIVDTCCNVDYWSVRRLNASPTPPCGIFNINYQRQARSWDSDCCCCLVVVLSCLVLSCLVALSEYQKVNKDDWLTVNVLYFQNLLSNWDSGEKVLKSFKEVGLANSERKLYPLKTLSVIYFRNPLSNWESGEKFLKSFKEVGLAKSEKKLHPYFSEDPKCYIFLKSSQQMWLS